MTRLTRRSVVLSAAAAGLAFGLDRPVEILSPAWAQGAGTGPSPMNPKGLKFHKFKVGDIEVTTVFDGNITRPHDPAFVRNASLDDVKSMLRAFNIPDNEALNTFTITVVKIGDRTIMFDAGNGTVGAPGTGQLSENLKAAGIDTAKLSALIVTHFHPDHFSGLMTKDNEQLFANTEIFVPEPEYKFWADPSVFSRLPEARHGIPRRIQATMPNWKNLKQAAIDKEVVPGIKALATHGHTPGHTSYLVTSGNASLIVLGDVTNIPAFNLKNPGWHLVVDQDAAMAEATRRRVFEQAVADKTMLTGYHWGMPGAGTLAKDGGGYVLAPVA